MRNWKWVVCAAVWGWGLVACGEKVPSERVTSTSTLCANDFQTCVLPVLTSQIRRRGGAVITCVECHKPGGNGGPFTLDTSDPDASFNAVRQQVNFTSPDESKLLVEPTQDDVAPSATAGPHGGGDIFPSRSDACYVAIHDWISNQVADQAASSCGLCTAVANPTASCGY
ncbi:MAG: cytochrome c [Gammaproteobacteria bacterium]|nr:cytochrome c [Gammaproteobacteria bacterium]